MIRNLVIAGSSFLINNHSSWFQLKENYKINFYNYGDLNGALSKKSRIILIDNKR